jgi:cytochrome P450
MAKPMTRIRRTTISPQHKTAPGPRGHLLLANAHDIQRDPLRFGLAMTQQYGDIVRMRLLLWPAYLINHPDGVKHVLQENQQNYNKDLYPYKIFKPLLGRGLVTNDGKSGLHHEETGQGMNDQQVRDEVMTLLIAGIECW